MDLLNRGMMEGMEKIPEENSEKPANGEEKKEEDPSRDHTISSLPSRISNGSLNPLRNSGNSTNQPPFDYTMVKPPDMASDNDLEPYEANDELIDSLENLSMELNIQQEKVLNAIYHLRKTKGGENVFQSMLMPSSQKGRAAHRHARTCFAEDYKHAIFTQETRTSTKVTLPHASPICNSSAHSHSNSYLTPIRHEKNKYSTPMLEIPRESSEERISLSSRPSSSIQKDPEMNVIQIQKKESSNRIRNYQRSITCLKNALQILTIKEEEVDYMDLETNAAQLTRVKRDTIESLQSFCPDQDGVNILQKGRVTLDEVNEHEECNDNIEDDVDEDGFPIQMEKNLYKENAEFENRGSDVKWKLSLGGFDAKGNMQNLKVIYGAPVRDSAKDRRESRKDRDTAEFSFAGKRKKKIIDSKSLLIPSRRERDMNLEEEESKQNKKVLNMELKKLREIYGIKDRAQDQESDEDQNQPITNSNNKKHPQEMRDGKYFGVTFLKDLKKDKRPLKELKQDVSFTISFFYFLLEKL